MPRLGGNDVEDGDDGARVPGQSASSLFNDKRRVVIAGLLFLFLFFMLKNATSTNYDDFTRDYYKSIGMESTARASMSKAELAKERVQLLTKVKLHETQITRLMKRVGVLEQHARNNWVAKGGGSGGTGPSGRQ